MKKMHKILVLVVLAIVMWLGYRALWGGGSDQPSYILGTVQKQTLTVSVSGVGQISSSDQVDVKPKVSADVTRVAVVAGSEVKAGSVLAYLDSRDASQSVQNSRIALENARITLRKLQQNQTSDAGSASEDLKRAYQDVLNSVTGAFLSLPVIMTDLQSATYGGQLGSTDIPNASDYFSLVGSERLDSFRTIVTRCKSDYRAAKAEYDLAFIAYRNLRRDATPSQIEEMAITTERVIDLTLQSLVSDRTMFDTVVIDIKAEALHSHIDVSIPSYIPIAQSVISADIGTMNGISSSLSTSMRSIENASQSLGNAQLTDPLDLASQQNTVSQREADLHNALIDLADHTIRAPLGGTVAKVNVRRGDNAGPSSAVATIISHQQIVNLSLNEVDVTKVKLGQKATFVFDAIDDLQMTGTVQQVDSIGTTTQGVVNYNVTIALDTQDARVRPGMSVSSVVIIEVHQDVLVVPIGAVKTQGDRSFVDALDSVSAGEAAAAMGVTSGALPRMIPVSIGVSDDTVTEIKDGLTEGQEIIVRTIQSSATPSGQTTQSRPGSIIPGSGGGGTRFIR